MVVMNLPRMVTELHHVVHAAGPTLGQLNFLKDFESFRSSKSSLNR